MQDVVLTNWEKYVYFGFGLKFELSTGKAQIHCRPFVILHVFWIFMIFLYIFLLNFGKIKLVANESMSKNQDKGEKFPKLTPAKQC